MKFYIGEFFESPLRNITFYQNLIGLTVRYVETYVVCDNISLKCFQNEKCFGQKL
jgi:hypothetical protein